MIKEYKIEIRWEIDSKIETKYFYVAAVSLIRALEIAEIREQSIWTKVYMVEILEIIN